MSKFEPSKRHLREILVYFFNLKKSAAEAHQLLVEAYGEGALSEINSKTEYSRKKTYAVYLVGSARCSVL